MWALTLLSLVAVLVPFGHGGPGGHFFRHFVTPEVKVVTPEDNFVTPEDNRKQYNIGNTFNEFIFQGYWFNDCTDFIDNTLDDTNDRVQAFPYCMQIKDVPDYYNVIAVAFMKSKKYGDIPTFSPHGRSGMNDENFKEQITELNRSRDVAVILSLGGKDSRIYFKEDKTDELKHELIRLAEKYGFNGVDIKLNSVSMYLAKNERSIIDASKYVKNYFNNKATNSNYYKQLYFIIALSEERGYRTDRDYRFNVYVESLFEETFQGDKKWVNYIVFNTDSEDSASMLSYYESANEYLRIPYNMMVHAVPANRYISSWKSGGEENHVNQVKTMFQAQKDAGTPFRGVSIWTINWEAGKFWVEETQDYEKLPTSVPALFSHLN